MTSNSADTSIDLDETQSQEEFLAFKAQLEKVQSLIDVCNAKIVDQTLCAADVTDLISEIKIMTDLENLVTAEKMKTNCVPYRTWALKIIQKSYPICNWLMEKQCKEMDNVFDVNSYIDLILFACADKEDKLGHMNSLFSNVMKNTNYFGLNFFGNLKIEESTDLATSIQCKKQIKRSVKRPLEEQVVPVEVDNEVVDNELKKTLVKINKCLMRVVKRNKGNPISFHKFAIDPFSLTYTIENIFHLASLAKDQLVKIERVSDGESDEFATITFSRPKDEISSKKDDIISSLFTMNNDLWKEYVTKYKITERLIDQDG